MDTKEWFKKQKDLIYAILEQLGGKEQLKVLDRLKSTVSYKDIENPDFMWDIQVVLRQKRDDED